MRKDFPLKGKIAALIIIDIQKYLSTPDSPEEAKSEVYFYEEAFPRAVRNINKLAQAFRKIRDDPNTFQDQSGCEVIFTYLQAATVTGRDISVDYKLSGPKLTNIPRSNCTPDDLFLEDCKPDPVTAKGDILLPKTSCSVFVSTNLDYLLRNLGVEQVVICGQLTDQCVESAVRDAADLGYLVTVAEDACAASSADDHLKGLQGVKGFCRILETDQVIDELLYDLSHSLKKPKPAKVKSGNSEPALLTEEAVLTYLRGKGLEGAAEQLTKVFEQKSKSEAMKQAESSDETVDK